MRVTSPKYRLPAVIFSVVGLVVLALIGYALNLIAGSTDDSTASSQARVTRSPSSAGAGPREPSLTISPGAPEPAKVDSSFGWKYPFAAGEKRGRDGAKFWALQQSDAADAPFLATQKRMQCAFAYLSIGDKVTQQVRLDAEVAARALCGDWTKEQLNATSNCRDEQLLMEGAKRGDLAARLALVRHDKTIDPQVVVDLAGEGVKTQHAGFFAALKSAVLNAQAQQRLKVVGYPVAAYYGHIAVAAEILACEFGTDCGTGSMFRLRGCAAAGWRCGNEDVVTELTRNETPKDRVILLDILARLRTASYKLAQIRCCFSGFLPYFR